MLLYNHKDEKNEKAGYYQGLVEICNYRAPAHCWREHRHVQPTLRSDLVLLSQFHTGMPCNPLMPLLATQPREILIQVHKGILLAALVLVGGSWKQAGFHHWKTR